MVQDFKNADVKENAWKAVGGDMGTNGVF